MIMSFLLGEGLKVVESGFSGVGRERSDDRKCVCCSQAIIRFERLFSLHEKLDLHKFTRCKYGAKKCFPFG